MPRHRHPEWSRTRQHGTTVTNTGGDPAVKIAALRAIVNGQGYAKIDGVTVDLFTASAIVKVYDALNEERRARYAKLSVPAMAHLAWKFVKVAA